MGKAHRKSIIKESMERLDSLMAIGKSRYEAKQAARKEAQARGEPFWSFSTGEIHSHKTRIIYQEHALGFVKWARATEGMKTLAELDLRANEQANRYLQMEIDAHMSADTLQGKRSALRMFFGNRALAKETPLPRRELAKIKRSRGPAARDRHFQPANWQPFLKFQAAVGLRRDELRRITVADVYSDHQGQLVAYVKNAKGGKDRESPVLAGHEQDVLAVVAERKPEERIFSKLPDTDLHAIRREYAQALYRQYAPGWPPLPPVTQRLKPTDYNKDAVMKVSLALGHSRIDVVLRNYLR